MSEDVGAVRRNMDSWEGREGIRLSGVGMCVGVYMGGRNAWVWC